MAASCGARSIPNPDRQDDDLNAQELKTTLDREGRLVVERPREQILSLEHELTREYHGSAELLYRVHTDPLELLNEIGSEGVAILGVQAHALGDSDVLLEVTAHLLFQRAELMHALELGRIHGPHRDENDVSIVAREEPLDRKHGMDAKSAVALDQHDCGRPLRGELRLGLR